MNRSIPDFSPYIPGSESLDKTDLPDKAVALAAASARLAGMLSPKTRQTIVRHMAVIDSYYSNLIEGNRTRPHEIRAAQQGDFPGDPSKRDLALESLAHIQVQAWLTDQHPDGDTLYTPEFIQSIHAEFYRHVPEALRQLKNTGGEVVGTVVPGQWRPSAVTVGQHVAPPPDQIAALMAHFCEAYRPSRYAGEKKILACLCAHHRLAWIHPFADGNGRVMRLLTDASLKALGMESGGVWCLSRGLARASDQYKAALAQADAPRRGDVDGRGVLSEQALVAFCDFMLDTALDQVRYISDLLALDQIQKRITGYIQARNEGRVSGLGKIKPVAGLVLTQAFVNGELDRSLAIELCAMPERTARRLLAQLKEEGLLSDTSSRSPLAWEIPEHVEPWYFPQLMPGG